VLNVVDSFSKFAWAFFVKGKTSAETHRCFRYLFEVLKEVPIKIKTDNGTEFKNNSVQSYIKQCNVEQVFGIPYKPNMQGVVEAFNKT
jgi:transposase InsO family protein